MSVFFILLKSRMLHIVLPLCLTVVVLLLVQSCEGSLAAKSELISDKHIKALAGDDVILSCYLVPANSASSETVVWTRPDLYPKYIHVQKDGKPVCSSQNLLYFNRTALFEDQLKHGNVSLKLFRVKISDTGEYRCILPSIQKETLIQLTVFSNDVQSKLICSDQPIIALAGEDVIFPCHLDPPINASSETVLWSKLDLNPKYIHVRLEGRLLSQPQNPSYTNRTALFEDELQNGNVSLKLSTTKVSDAGKYFCFVRSVKREESIKLTVGAASIPVIVGTNRTRTGLALQCESKGWYPEPEVVWLDGEGNLLSAGPTETVRGPDDLYTVSSRVTVEKRHSNNFTCRVQQKDINQTRETHIYISVLSTYVKCVLAPGLIAVLLAAVLKIRRCCVENTRYKTGEQSPGTENSPT